MIFLHLLKFIQQVLCAMYNLTVSNTDDKIILQKLNAFTSDHATTPRDIQPRRLIFDQTCTVS